MKQFYLPLILLSIIYMPFARAQNGTNQPPDSVKAKTYKIFGGNKQYNTWSIGVNIGATSPTIQTGGGSDFRGNVVSLGYGISVRDQLAHSFGLQFDLNGGQVSGAAGKSQAFVTNPAGLQYASYVTNFWQETISGVINVGTVNYLRRKSSITFYINAGIGLDNYKPILTAYPTGALFKYPNTVSNLVVPLGGGIKFRVTDNLAINVGYTENFVDGDNLDGVYAGITNDHYSYGYAGAVFGLGPKAKANLDWVNPVAKMYDELYDKEMRMEVEALKKRTAAVENTIKDLKKDSDGDGVSDQFDKCPNTAAGSVVDGAGCPIKMPAVIDTSDLMRKPTGK